MNETDEKLFTILENVIFLKKTHLFSSLETDELRTIALIIKQDLYKRGEQIVRENDYGDSLFVIKEGSVDIVKKVSEAKSIKLAELRVGDCFGEMALFDAELRSASVYAREDCVLLNLRSDDINDILIDNPTIAIEFIKIFVKRLRKANAGIEKLMRNR
ncbi:MAG: cyclic nucleotide-binding domain-containing protein [Chitinispirillia bacterium]